MLVYVLGSVDLNIFLEKKSQNWAPSRPHFSCATPAKDSRLPAGCP